MGKAHDGEDGGGIPWSADLAYVVGLLATDGNLSTDRRHIFFTSKDAQLMDTFLRCLGRSNRPHVVRGPTGSEALQVAIGDVKLYRWLERHGVSRRKSLTLGAIDVPDEHFFSLVRGLLDGDGSISAFCHAPTKRKYPDYIYERLIVRFTSASAAHIEWLHRELGRRGISGSVRRQASPGRTAMHILSLGKKASIELLNRLYVDETAPRLQRKWKIWEDYRTRLLCRRRDSNPHALSDTAP